jgi:ABC-type branched-subunit amino acid transport system substrate-binding protein
MTNNITRNRPSRITRAVASLAVVAVGIGLAACSSSASKSTASGGQPIRIGLIAPTNTPTLNIPAVPSSVRAAIRAINASGGVKGHKLQLVYCNDKSDPNAAVQCAQQMVSSKVAAMVGDFSLFSTAILPILKKAGIPEIGATALAPQQYSFANSFLLDSGSFGPVMAAPVLAKDLGIKSMGIAYVNVPSGTVELAQSVATAKQAGVTVPAKIPVEVTETNFDPIITSLKNSGAQAALTILTEAQTVAFLKSYQALGAKFQVITLTEAITSQEIEALKGSAGTMAGALLLGTLPPFSATSQFKQLVQYRTDMAAEAKTGDATAKPAAWQPQGLAAWLGMYAVADVMNKSSAKTVTAATITSALNATKNLDLGLIPPWTPSKSVNAKLPRISNGAVFVVKVVNGVSVLDRPKPIDVFADAAR